MRCVFYDTEGTHFSKIEKSIWTPTDINNKEQTIKEIEP